MSNNYGPKIAKARNSGLILHIDPAELNSSGHLSQTNIVTNYQTATTTASNEERVEVSRDPWGRIALIDRSEGNDAGSNYDGGYTTSVFDVPRSIDISCDHIPVILLNIPILYSSHFIFIFSGNFGVIWSCFISFNNHFI